MCATIAPRAVDCLTRLFSSPASLDERSASARCYLRSVIFFVIYFNFAARCFSAISLLGYSLTPFLSLIVGFVLQEWLKVRWVAYVIME